ncbi:Proton/glutamate symporter @ Sodium/glutamate symporter, partial [hydrothermal vent metagenome]
MFKALTSLQLHWQILISLVLAVIAGIWSGVDATIFGISFFQIYDFFGKLFLNALKMLIVPLIVSSIIVGIMGMGSGNDLGRLGGKTLLYYTCTSFFAIVTGLLLVNLTMPGIIDGVPIKDLIGLGDIPPEVSSSVDGKGAGDIVAVFLRMVPPNIVAAAANGQMLGLIFFSLLFGFFVTKLSSPQAETMKSFWQGVLDVMMHMTNWVMK